MNMKSLIAVLTFGIIASAPVQAWMVPDDVIKTVEVQEPIVQSSSLDAELLEPINRPKPFPSIQKKSNLKKKKTSVLSQKVDLFSEEALTTRNNDSVKEIAQTQTFDKQPSALDSQEQVILNYSQALEFIQKGMDKEAQGLLLDNLSNAPNHMLSRIALANLYLRLKQDLDAEQMVAEGLKRGNNLELLKLMAILMERRGQPNIALDYLNKIPPEYKNDRNTTMLLGNIYQKTGHFELAKSQYDRLMSAEPNNPLWLLGVTMALEGGGKKREALKGYLKLQSDPTLEPSVRNYVSERILSLRG